MCLKIALPFALLALASARDIDIGQNITEARKIFDEKREASPAVWRQTEQVIINTTGEEIISRVVITDLRPDKNGDAAIIEGGEGNQTVTIELKSPTVLRGYDFHIEVYAISKGAAKGNEKPLKTSDVTHKPLNIHPPKAIGSVDFTSKPPVPLSTDFQINDGKRMTRNSEAPKTNIKPDTFSTAAPKTEFETKKNATSEKDVDIQKDITRILPGFNKSNDEPTHLPLDTEDLKTKDGIHHPRLVRDTSKKDQSTTTPSTVKAPKELGQEIIFPLIHEDKISGNSEKLNAGELKSADNSTTTVASVTTTKKPRETRGAETTTTKTDPKHPSEKNEDIKQSFDITNVPQAHVDKISGSTDKYDELKDDHKELKTNKDHSTTVPSVTTTDKPRAVRNADGTTPKTDMKEGEKNYDSQYIQKIPASGRVTIPKEFLESHNATDPKTTLENKNTKTFDPKLPLPMQHKTLSASSTKPPKSVKESSSSSSEDTSSESSENIKFSSPLPVKSLASQKDEKPLIH